MVAPRKMPVATPSRPSIGISVKWHLRRAARGLGTCAAAKQIDAVRRKQGIFAIQQLIAVVMARDALECAG
jgi:hypothetical protein